MEKESGGWHPTHSRVRSDSLFEPRETQAGADALFVLTLRGRVCVARFRTGKLSGTVTVIFATIRALRMERR